MRLIITNIVSMNMPIFQAELLACPAFYRPYELTFKHLREIAELHRLFRVVSCVLVVDGQPSSEAVIMPGWKLK
jgi:hypothetical protein